MTGDEILGAWEKVLATGDAPIGEHWGCSVTTKLAKETLDKLKHQRAEIERLQRNENLVTSILSQSKLYGKPITNLEVFLKYIEKLQAEAIKEFAERLKELSYLPDLSLTNMEVVDIATINNLVKEMTE